MYICMYVFIYVCVVGNTKYVHDIVLIQESILNIYSNMEREIKSNTHYYKEKQEMK